MGASQILDAILSEAQSDAEAVLADAENTAKATLAAAKADAEQRAQALLADAQTSADTAAERDMLSAELEARKTSLQGRRALLDDVFQKAADSLCALGKKDYIALVTRLVADAAETGCEQLQVSAAEHDRYVRPYDAGKTMLQILNSALKDTGLPGRLTLHDTPGSFSGGVKLIGELADIDCSFASLVESYRDAREADVSRMLFGGKES